MKPLWKSVSGIFVGCIAIVGVSQGYGYLKTTPIKGELGNSEYWDDMKYNITDELEDFRVLYAQQEENDISHLSLKGDWSDNLLPSGEIETFDLSFLEPDNVDPVTGTYNNSNNYNYSSPTGSVSSVPNKPTQTYSAPAGNWCVYQGSALVKSFTASDFPAKYRQQCQNVYNSVIKGVQATVTFDNENDLDNVTYIFQAKYGISRGMYGEMSGGRFKGYYYGLQANRVSSASYAEKIVQQLFPNGATANQVVWGCCNWLMGHVRYQAGSPSSDVLFRNGVGNCNAFASALKQMCNAMGIQCDIVAGQAYGVSAWGGHAWNLVYINGVAYHVDACFYATSGGNRSYVLSPGLWSDHSQGVVNNNYINS